MKLTDLRQFAVGDLVDIDDGIVGEVMCSTEREEWSAAFSETDWPKSEYNGIMVRESDAGLVFHPTEYFTEHSGRIKHCSETT